MNPKLCSVCNRISFLKCIECDRVYCSEKCRIKDWDDHIRSHLKKSERKSVNNRLIPHRMGENSEEIAASPRKAELTAKMENLSVFSDLEIKRQQQAKNRDILILRKFKRHVPICKEILDSEGYFFAVVTDIATSKNISHVYSIIPYDYKKSLESYIEELQEIYENEGSAALVLQNEVSKKDLLLFMVKISGKWTRCIVHDFKTQANLICLEDIDSGKKYETDYSTLSIKSANDSEIAKFAYCLKVGFLNSYNHDSINVGDIIKIKIPTPSAYFSVASLAEVFIDIAENESSMQTDMVNTENRIFINQISVREFKTSRNMNVMFLDGQNLSIGLLHVCEKSDENFNFYSKLNDDINQYVKANPDANNYKPIASELILTKFTDGNAYRTMCINVNEFDCKVYFMDYGNDMIVGFEDIWKMPKQFVKYCVSRTVRVKLKSGRPIEDIDVEETKEKLSYMETFEADINEIGEKKYSITVDDSLVVFKK